MQRGPQHGRLVLSVWEMPDPDDEFCKSVCVCVFARERKRDRGESFRNEQRHVPCVQRSSQRTHTAVRAMQGLHHCPARATLCSPASTAAPSCVLAAPAA
jgi:hypothetical protein